MTLENDFTYEQLDKAAEYNRVCDRVDRLRTQFAMLVRASTGAADELKAIRLCVDDLAKGEGVAKSSRQNLAELLKEDPLSERFDRCRRLAARAVP